MRYFLHLAYNGARYAGWQRQPHAASVQQVLEDSFSTILGRPIEMTGCGRTDTGVHAASYYAHFDFDGAFPEGFPRRINKFLPPDIAVYHLLPVGPDAHARFDARYRAYFYHISLRKNPFRTQTSYFYPFADRVDPDKLRAAAALLPEYEQFLPFCKTGSDAKTMRCQLFRSEWELREDQWIYHIAANRFLRGMVRLCVGMCLSVGTGQIELDSVRQALDRQERLVRALSVPPEGLFLSEIRYPYPLDSPIPFS